MHIDQSQIYSALSKKLHTFDVCSSCRNISLGVKEGVPCIRIAMHNNDHYVRYESAREATQQYIILIENAFSDTDCETFLKDKTYDISTAGYL